MVKFRCLIHKETGTVIKYEEWLEQFKENGFISTSKNNGKFLYDMKSYMPDEAIFSDDFEIIYDSEFTECELDIIYADCKQKEVKEKIGGIINRRNDIEIKYGIEV